MPREIGADNFVLSNKPESMAAAAKSLDLILNTVSADHDLTALIGDSQMMLVMMMKSTRRMTAVTRVRIQSAKMAPSCIWNE